MSFSAPKSPVAPKPSAEAAKPDESPKPPLEAASDGDAGAPKPSAAAPKPVDSPNSSATFDGGKEGGGGLGGGGGRKPVFSDESNSDDAAPNASEFPKPSPPKPLSWVPDVPNPASAPPKAATPNDALAEEAELVSPNADRSNAAFEVGCVMMGAGVEVAAVAAD